MNNANEVGQPIDCDPKDFSSLVRAASLTLQHGDPRKGIELAHGALEFRPGDTEVLQLIGRCWQAMARPFEALQAFDAVVQLAPRQPSGYFGLADVFVDQGSSFDAAEALAIGTKLAPNVLRCIQLAEKELALGRPAFALKAALQALDLDRSSLSANLIAGRCLTELGNLDGAEPYWLAAKADRSLAWRVEGQKGYALAIIGRFAESEVSLKECLRLNPRQGSAYELLFAGRKASASDHDLIRDMEELAQSQSLEDAESAPLHFALGKAWDDLGNPAEAMRHFDTANDIRLRERGATRPFALRHETARWDLFRDLFQTAAPRKEGLAGGQPIFVVGMMRSGTTLLEQILSAHPHVAGAGELDFWHGSEALIVDADNRRLRMDSLSERRNAYMRLINSFGGHERRVVDKFHANLRIAGLIHQLFPDSPIIHVHRNPVDTAISMWMTDSSAAYLWDRKHIVFAVRQAIEQANHWRSVLPANRFLDVRYEDLVADPEQVTREVLDFCDLPWDDACLRANSLDKSVRTVSAWQVRQPIYRSSVDRWRRYEPWLGEFEVLKDGVE